MHLAPATTGDGHPSFPLWVRLATVRKEAALLNREKERSTTGFTNVSPR